MNVPDLRSRVATISLWGLSIVVGLVLAWTARTGGRSGDDLPARPRFEPAPATAETPPPQTKVAERSPSLQPLPKFHVPSLVRAESAPPAFIESNRPKLRADAWELTATQTKPRYPLPPEWTASPPLARAPNEAVNKPSPALTMDDDDLLIPDEPPAPQPARADPPAARDLPKDTSEDDDLRSPSDLPPGPPGPQRTPPVQTDDEDDLLAPPRSNGPAGPSLVPPNSPPYSPPVRSPQSQVAAEPAPVQGPTEPDPHAALFAKNCYPSARECAVCHQQHFDEWSVSSHGYACISPMFHRFEQKISELAQGTLGTFCMRCHSPVGMAMGMERDTPIWDMPHAAREGVTCIVCHRINQNYGKVNGERHIVPGPPTDPIYGTIGGAGVAQALARPDFYKVKTEPDNQPGQVIHREGRFFEQLGRSEFCASCHQVAVHPGIKLEVVYEQYRASPACKKGVQCHDCHMGKVPGKPEGFTCGPVAIMNGKAVHGNRKHSNHMFHGPGYSIAHPGIFPHNAKADKWSPDQWLQFDWRAGWGTREFEDGVAAGRIRCSFPPMWAEADDRVDAREVLTVNLERLSFKRQAREQVMENGSKVDGPFFETQPLAGQDLKLHFVVTNANEGHNLLTGSLGAQPQLWLNAALIGPDGRKVWESGYTDSSGDLCDIHSDDVRHKRMPFDSQLFNLQTMFLITNVKGPDREFLLPINVDFDQLPFIRPGAQPISVLNHPPFIRMEAHSLAPLGGRKAKYRIPAAALSQPGTYRLSTRMRSRAEPIYLMKFCGNSVEQQRSMNEGILDLHRHSVTFTVR